LLYLTVYLGEGLRKIKFESGMIQTFPYGGQVTNELIGVLVGAISLQRACFTPNPIEPKFFIFWQ